MDPALDDPASVLLLHGQPGSGQDWEGVISELGGRVAAIAPDRPGWDGVTKSSGLEDNAAAAVSALDQVGVGRAVVAGHSLGGAVAAWIAATRPERVARLVLLAPAANRESLVALDYVLAAPVLGELASAAALGAAGAALATRPLRRLISAELSVNTRYLGGAARRLLLPRTWGSFVAEQRMLIREMPRLEAQLDRIRAPTTIVIGGADRLVPPASAVKLRQQIPHAALLRLEAATHLLPQQNAGQVAQIILDRWSG